MSPKENKCFVLDNHGAVCQFSNLHNSDDAEGRLFTLCLSFLEEEGLICRLILVAVET